MRASSLSNAKVIDLLNHYFVPVHVSNQGCSAEERVAKDRIYRAALTAGLKAGTVCAYFIAPDGRPLATAPLNEKLATDPERLAEVMERIVGELKVPRGEPLAKPKTAATPPIARKDDFVLHVVARYLQRQGDDYVPVDVTNVLGTKKGGNWGDLPSEDWVVLSKSAWQKFLPSGNVALGNTWEPPQDVMVEVLKRLYPPTENTDLKKNRVDEQPIRATVEAIDKGIARARLEGRLRMKHPFYHVDDANFVTARLVGYVEFHVNGDGIRSFQLVTDDGRYGGDVNGVQRFGAAVRSVVPSKE